MSSGMFEAERVNCSVYLESNAEQKLQSYSLVQEKDRSIAAAGSKGV